MRETNAIQQTWKWRCREREREREKSGDDIFPSTLIRWFLDKHHRLSPPEVEDWPAYSTTPFDREKATTSSSLPESRINRPITKQTEEHRPKTAYCESAMEGGQGLKECLSVCVVLRRRPCNSRSCSGSSTVRFQSRDTRSTNSTHLPPSLPFVFSSFSSTASIRIDRTSSCSWDYAFYPPPRVPVHMTRWRDTLVVAYWSS